MLQCSRQLKAWFTLLLVCALSLLFVFGNWKDLTRLSPSSTISAGPRKQPKLAESNPPQSAETGIFDKQLSTAISGRRRSLLTTEEDYSKSHSQTARSTTEMLLTISSTVEKLVVNSSITPVTHVCQIPQLDPWDPSIRELIHKRDALSCDEVQPYLSIADQENMLWLNETAVREILDVLPKHTELECAYAYFDRVEGSIKETKYQDQPPIALTPLIGHARVKLSRDYVKVRCYKRQKKGNTTKIVYSATHGVVVKQRRSQLTNRTYERETEENLSVLVFIVDSMSLSMYRRHLPQTYSLLVDRLGFYPLEGYSKVGDNSFPNVIPLLTGLRVDNQQKNMPSEIPGKLSEIYFDDFPLVWKNFSRRGYVTVYNEEMPHWGTFNYLKRGFKKPPVDHYYRPFWYATQYAEFPANESSKYCSGNFPKAQLQLDILRRVFRAYKGTKKFVFTYIVEVSHNRDYDLQGVDSMLVSFFAEMFGNELLNRTAVLFFSDHGHRFSAIRRTFVGRLEGNRPAFTIWFPDWFYRKHPLIRRALEANRRRLSTPFDIYETFRDILDGNFDGEQRPTGQRGLSQLYDLPDDRTCEAAGIPDLYCTCNGSLTQLNASSKLAVDAGKFIVEEINAMLENVSSKCAKVGFESVLHGEQMVTSEGATRKKRMFVLNVALRLSPSKGIVESMVDVEVRRKSTTFALHGNDISRLDAYSSQSECINDPVLRKFCYCRNLLKKKKRSRT